MKKKIIKEERRIYMWFVFALLSSVFAALTSILARFEFTPSIPTFARIDVNAANTDDNNANTNHI